MMETLLKIIEKEKWNLHGLPSLKMIFTKKNRKLIVEIDKTSVIATCYKTGASPTEIIDSVKFKTTDSETKIRGLIKF